MFEEKPVITPDVITPDAVITEPDIDRRLPDSVIHTLQEQVTEKADDTVDTTVQDAKPDFIPDKFWTDDFKNVYKTLDGDKLDTIKQVFQSYSSLESEHTKTSQAYKEQEAITKVLLEETGFENPVEATMGLNALKQFNLTQQQLSQAVDEVDRRVKAGSLPLEEGIEAIGQLKLLYGVHQQKLGESKTKASNYNVVKKLVDSRQEDLQVPEIAVGRFTQIELEANSELDFKTMNEFIDYGKKIFEAGKKAATSTVKADTENDALKAVLVASSPHAATASTKSEHIYSRNEIGKMSLPEYKKNEAKIKAQQYAGKIIDDIS